MPSLLATIGVKTFVRMLIITIIPMRTTGISTVMIHPIVVHR